MPRTRAGLSRQVRRRACPSFDSGSVARPFPCPEDGCLSAFNRKADLNRHHDTVHKGIRNFVCPRQGCDARFPTRKMLADHYNTHTGEKPYRCNIGSCHAAFGEAGAVCRHRIEVHGKLKTHVCWIPGCGARIKRRSAFNQHLKTKHDLPGLPRLHRGARLREAFNEGNTSSEESNASDDDASSWASSSDSSRTPSPTIHSDAELVAEINRVLTLDNDLDWITESIPASCLAADAQGLPAYPYQDLHIADFPPTFIPEDPTDYSYPSTWDPIFDTCQVNADYNVPVSFPAQYPACFDDLSYLTNIPYTAQPY